ncbi:sulfatase [Wenyingzhuangia sp. 1_MG-2023]|nr:sulfatase [Wenyingzhuangia sp. 1_MG-2023]
MKIIILVLVMFISNYSIAQKNKEEPNIILIFADDLGYGDISSYGAKGVATPNIDKIGEDGIKFMDFFIPSNVCSPSRASLLTGRYPMRNGFPVPINYKRKKQANYGLHPDELTIPMFLKEANYNSICIGKWHLGYKTKGSHPLDKGFDEYYGRIEGFNHANRNEQVVFHQRDSIKAVAFEELMELYTNKAIDFIHKNKEKPFFLYLAHHAVHLPILPSEKFKGTSKIGAYGDFIHELDDSTGKVMKALKEAGVEENTLVIFTSDNGPARAAVKVASTGGLSGGKYGTMEGGHRVPGMMSWKGKIKKGQVSNLTISSMDLLPTIAAMVEKPLPKDRIYDGENILPLLKGESHVNPHKLLYYYNGTNLQAVRKGNWKLHIPRTVNDQPFWCKVGDKRKGFVNLSEYKLYNLKEDVSETKNLSLQYPKLVEELKLEAEKIRKELGDVHVVGRDQRVVPFDNPQEK